MYIKIMNKIANHIIEEDFSEQTFRSLKLGFCHAMSEMGMSPKDSESLLQKCADFNIDPVELIKQYSLLLTAGGAGLGYVTAKLRSKVDNIAKNTESPEMRISKAKVEAYKKMIANIREQNNMGAQQELVDATGSV
jgi:hypothetical protein